MRIRTTITAFAAATLLALTGCAAEDTGTDPAPKEPAASQENDTQKDSGASTEDDAPAAEQEAETATLPDMTGKVLQTAQDEAQALGFYSLTSSDATGADRFQAFDRNWKVCSQTPGPGEHPTDTTIDFATVKLSESC